uniref:Uncharacterized protein n=1 Tax=Romanomermis culicivorax TaxID=13658 RepID=A0A915JKV0_ROMCU
MNKKWKRKTKTTGFAFDVVSLFLGQHPIWHTVRKSKSNIQIYKLYYTFVVTGIRSRQHEIIGD